MPGTAITGTAELLDFAIAGGSRGGILDVLSLWPIRSLPGSQHLMRQGIQIATLARLASRCGCMHSSKCGLDFLTN
eukprot:2176667-Pleurochrysis_carterae.AAC.1